MITRASLLALPLLATSVLGGQSPRPTAPALTIGRLHYDGGGDWYANPTSVPNLLAAIRARTAMRTSPTERVVQLSDPDLWDVPYLYATGHGNITFSGSELVTLRRWLLQGGFLHVDDNYGLDESWRREVARLFPDRPMVEVPLDHPIYRVVYALPNGLPKVHEHDAKPAQGFGVFVEGRLVLYYSYQSDLGDGWEDPAVHGDPLPLREAALQMGVNLFAYAVGWGG